MMLCRVITLRFDPALEGFNDQPLRDFLADKEVHSIHDHFFEQQGVPYLSLVVCYRLLSVSPPKQNSAVGEKPGRDESWRNTLTPELWPLFNTLRDWRGDRARIEGIPSYVICNNRQLAEVVVKRPTTLGELAHVDGFGEAKLKKYGPELLAMLCRAFAAPQESNDGEA
jgi:ATP-dependent DNA helicase RecQ